MNTENIDAEYSIFYLLFTKAKFDVYRYLMDNGVNHEYFSVIFHRKISKMIFKLLHDNHNYTLNSFHNYFLNHESDEKELLAYEEFETAIKEHKSNIDDIEINTKIITECYATRKLFKVISESIDDKKKPTLELIQEIKQRCLLTEEIINRNSIKRKMGLKSGLEDRIKRAEDVHDNPNTTGMVLTGLKNLDKWIGRQSPGQFIIYQARTGVGKSMMLMGTALANFKKGLKVIVITIEMSDYDYLYRFDSNLTGIEHREFSQGDIVTDSDKIALWKNKIQKCGNGDSDINVYWVPDNCTPATVERIVEENEFKPDLVVVDYAGDMSSGLAGIPDFDARAHAEIYASLKRIAGKYNCVVYTAQQSKRGTQGKASTETGAWSDIASAKADVMFAVEVTREDEDFMSEVDGNVVIGRMTVSVIKGRNIPKCKTHIIPRFSRMSWLEREEEEMIPCGNGKEIPTAKKKAKQSEEAMDKQIESNDAENTDTSSILSGE